MTEFSNAKFVCFGDSGEQDLELYTSIARERPTQVIAVFIRDVTSGRAEQLRRTPLARLPTLDPDDTKLSQDFASREGSVISSGAGTPTTSGSHKNSLPDDITGALRELQALTAVQQKVLKRAALWESRVEQARLQMPGSVKLVFFKDSEEIRAEVLGLVVAAPEMIQSLETVQGVV